MHCPNCGKEVEGKFCSNCGKEIVDFSQEEVNSQVNEYFMNKINNAKNHNTYKKVIGIIMLVLGIIVALVYTSDKYTFTYRLIGIDTAIVFLIPGLLCATGGLLSLLSKENNTLLLVSGICYILTAVINTMGIKDVSILGILSIIFGIINIVYATKKK